MVSDPNCTFLQFSLTPEKIGLVFLSNSVLYVLVAPFAGKIADKIVSETLVIPYYGVCTCVLCDAHIMHEKIFTGGCKITKFVKFLPRKFPAIHTGVGACPGYLVYDMHVLNERDFALCVC